MNKSRYNIYTVIHKALRAAMSDTLVALGRVDDTDDDSVADALDRTGELLALCQGHLEHENEYIHPAMLAARPGMDIDTVHDHEHHERAIIDLGDFVERVRALKGDERRPALLELYRRVAVFVGENFIHMQLEETDNCEVLWSHYSDEQIIDIEHAIVASLSPQDNARISELMLPSLTVSERLELVGAMRAAMPEDAFAGLMTMLRARLDPAAFDKLCSGLGLDTATTLAA